MTSTTNTPATDTAKTPYERLEALGLKLPQLPPPVANFAIAVRHGDLLYVSGQGPVSADSYHTGKVGDDVTWQEAYEHAKLTGLNLLAAVEQAAGSLNKVSKVVKLLGMVNATPDFMAHPYVINGCSDLLVAVFGPELGMHARSAIGVGSLPGQITVELEMVVALSD